LEERGSWSARRRPLGAEWSTNKLHPHFTPDLGIERGGIEPGGSRDGAVVMDSPLTNVAQVRFPDPTP